MTVRAYRHLRRLASSSWRHGVTQGVLVVVVLVLAALVGASAAMAATARPRTAPDPQQAARLALRALGVQQHRGGEIVFGLRAPIVAHTVVTAGGPPGPALGGQPEASRATVAIRAGRAAWLFYDDRAPFQAYEHPGRVALVDAATGRVTLSGTLRWPPVLAGALPPFLRSADAYADPTDRVFYRPYDGGAALAARVREPQAALDAAQARRAAALLAAEHSCVVRFGDTLGGGYYAVSRVATSRTALAARFAQLQQIAPGFHTVTYVRGIPTALVRQEVAQRGCRDVLVYAAGSGYPGTTAINLGMQISRRTTRHQDLTLAALRRLIDAERGVTFTLVIDAPSAAGFQQLTRLRNVRVVATPVGPAGGSFTFLPEAVVGGTLRRNDTNPAGVLQLTDRLVFGLAEVIDDPCEVTAAAARQRAGTSALADLVARALARGGAVDWVARSGVGSPPEVRTTGFSAATPTCLPPDALTATDDAYTAGNNAVIGVPPARGVLANDSDTQHHAVSVDQLDGNGGSLPLKGTSATGAAVTLHGNGGFSYNASAVPALLALPRGQTTTDTFTYRATDGLGATATATVTLTVTGTLNHLPTAQADAATTPSSASITGSDVRVNDTDADADALTIDQLNGLGGTFPLHGTTGKGAAVTLNANGTYTYDPTGSPTLQALAHGQSTTDSFTYRVNDGHGGTATAPVTITVTGMNHPPTAANDGSTGSPVATTNADTALTNESSLFGNDSDPDTGDTLSLSAADTVSAKGAAVTVNSNGTWSYDPTTSSTLQALTRGQSTTDTFTYSVKDNHSATSNTATVTVGVTGVNHAPVANPDSYQVATGQTVQGNVLTNDTDADGDQLTAILVSGPSNASAFTLNSDGSFTYTHDGSATTTDSFTYKANDGTADSNTVTVTINITP